MTKTKSPKTKGDTQQCTVYHKLKVTAHYSDQKLYKDKDNTTHNKIETQTNSTVTINQAVERCYACS